MQNSVVEYNGIKFNVEFEINGVHLPQTHEQPEEIPEIEITKITVEDSDIDLYEFLSWEQTADIEKLIGEKHEI